MLKNNPDYIKSCILYEVLNNSPVFVSYRSFCGKLGHDVMEYVDFEYWYYRFYNGHLDFDWSQEPRNKKKTTLLELPTDVFEKIQETFTIRERLALRKVCRSIQFHLNQVSTGVKRLHFSFDKHESIIRMAGMSKWESWFPSRKEMAQKQYEMVVVYENEPPPIMPDNFICGDCLVRTSWWTEIARQTAHWDVATHDLMEVLSNPKDNIKQLILEQNETSPRRHLDTLASKLAALLGDRKIHVEQIEIVSADSSLDTLMLPYLDASKLKEVTVELKGNEEEEQRRRIERLIEMEQWKRAEKRTIRVGENFVIGGPLLNCSKFILEFKDEELTVEYLSATVNTLINSPAIESVEIKTDVNLKSETFEPFFGIRNTRLPHWHLSSNDGNHKFTMSIFTSEIALRKVFF